ncbi:MAG: hypothetical protein SGI77_06765 [Pirellulaceae bacterium]|nr:hypothetical protein [Pirellulaceae bacterium]
MGSMQRADRFEQLSKALKKHYKPVAPVTDRKVLDHLLYACCLQDATYEAADEAFAKLQQAYFDSNEIRVTTIAELTESLTSLQRAPAAANRIKKSLQSMFESRYSFDIDDMKKSNLGKAVDEITGWQGVTKFVVSYVTQHAFGGHSIPVDESTLTVCHLLDLVSSADVEKGHLTGIERAIPKNKGLEFASLLHQFAVDHAASHKNALVVAVFKELGMTSKPKAPPPPPEPPKVAKGSKAAASPKTADAKSQPKGTKSGSPAIVASKTKGSESAKPDKLADTKTAKGSVLAKPSKLTKMSTPPAAAAKPTLKTTAATAKSASTGKKSDATSGKKSSSKSDPKLASKKPEKPSSKKMGAKQIEAKNSASKSPKKKATQPPAKPITKGSAGTAKPAPKKLPVKPVTKKRTKPR